MYDPCPNCSKIIKISHNGFCSWECEQDYDDFIDRVFLTKEPVTIPPKAKNPEFIKDLHKLLAKYE